MAANAPHGPRPRRKAEAVPDHAILCAASILVSVVFFALTGGADFGGGVWYLLASGPRKEKQRRVVARAIGPVWETNHVWLIAAAVILLAAFPRAFAAICTALFVPVSLMLAGIVLRGAAFAFHTYRLDEDKRRGRWGMAFAGASAATPVVLGILAAAVAQGKLSGDPTRGPAPPAAWLSLFTVSAGLLALALFSFLAAVYLVMETRDPLLQDDFRKRAIHAARAVALLAAAAVLSAGRDAPGFHDALVESPWSVPIFLGAATAAVGGYTALHLRGFALARACGAALAVFILVGFGLAQDPFLVRPDISIAAAAANPSMLRLLFASLVGGAALLFPAIFVLFRIFETGAPKGGPSRREEP